jgi:hypothetical protein
VGGVRWSEEEKRRKERKIEKKRGKEREGKHSFRFVRSGTGGR